MANNQRLLGPTCPKISTGSENAVLAFLGPTILMGNGEEDTRQSIVTCLDRETLTRDRIKPMCDREVISRLDILPLRDAALGKWRRAALVQSQ